MASMIAVVSSCGDDDSATVSALANLYQYYYYCAHQLSPTTTNGYHSCIHLLVLQSKSSIIIQPNVVIMFNSNNHHSYNNNNGNYNKNNDQDEAKTKTANSNLFVNFDGKKVLFKFLAFSSSSSSSSLPLFFISEYSPIQPLNQCYYYYYVISCTSCTILVADSSAATSNNNCLKLAASSIIIIIINVYDCSITDYEPPILLVVRWFQLEQRQHNQIIFIIIICTKLIKSFYWFLNQFSRYNIHWKDILHLVLCLFRQKDLNSSSSCLMIEFLENQIKNPITTIKLPVKSTNQICIILHEYKISSSSSSNSSSYSDTTSTTANFSSKTKQVLHVKHSNFQPRNSRMMDNSNKQLLNSTKQPQPILSSTRWHRNLFQCFVSTLAIKSSCFAQLFLFVNLVASIASANVAASTYYAPMPQYGMRSQSNSMGWSSGSSAAYRPNNPSNADSNFKDATPITKNSPHSPHHKQQLHHHHNLHHHHQAQQQQQHGNSIASLTSRIAKDAPEFADEMSNLTVALGRDVVFECVVNNLGSYKLAWLKINDSLNSENLNYWNVDGGSGNEAGSGSVPGGQVITTEPTLISIQSQMMLTDPRFRVTHNNYRQWFLHIKQIKPSDRGYYMCQINAEPIISQAAFLDILIAPSIDYSVTSSDVSVDERHRLSIRCRANGYPPPTMIWRREDNKDINLGLYGGKRYSAAKVEGEFLNITQVTRDDMGAYLCIASNSVPPSVSKRIIVRVNFRPKIKVSNQLVGSMLGSDVQLECRCEASPTPTTLWTRYDGAVLINSPKYQLHEDHDSYRTKMKLKIINLDDKDFGSYKCMAKNSLGEKEGLVRLYEIASPSTPNSMSSWPTYIYSYQGRNKSSGVLNNNNNNMLGDHNNDYQQAASSSSSSSASSSSLSASSQNHHQSLASMFIQKHFTILLSTLLLFAYSL